MKKITLDDVFSPSQTPLKEQWFKITKKPAKQILNEEFQFDDLLSSRINALSESDQKYLLEEINKMTITKALFILDTSSDSFPKAIKESAGDVEKFAYTPIVLSMIEDLKKAGYHSEELILANQTIQQLKHDKNVYIEAYRSNNIYKKSVYHVSVASVVFTVVKEHHSSVDYTASKNEGHIVMVNGSKTADHSNKNNVNLLKSNLNLLAYSKKNKMQSKNTALKESWGVFGDAYDWLSKTVNHSYQSTKLAFKSKDTILKEFKEKIADAKTNLVFDRGYFDKFTDKESLANALKDAGYTSINPKQISFKDLQTFAKEKVLYKDELSKVNDLDSLKDAILKLPGSDALSKVGISNIKNASSVTDLIDNSAANKIVANEIVFPWVGHSSASDDAFEQKETLTGYINSGVNKFTNWIKDAPEESSKFITATKEAFIALKDAFDEYFTTVMISLTVLFGLYAFFLRPTKEYIKEYENLQKHTAGTNSVLVKSVKDHDKDKAVFNSLDKMVSLKQKLKDLFVKDVSSSAGKYSKELEKDIMMLKKAKEMKDHRVAKYSPSHSSQSHSVSHNSNHDSNLF